jgi:hypothetical protein
MNEEMMSLKELRKAKLNPLLVEIAFTESEKHLIDILECRKEFDSKAFTLLAGYMAAATTLLSLVVSNVVPCNAMVPLTISACLFCLGAVFLSISLKGFDYGFLGSDPARWLRKNVVDSQDNAELIRMKAYQIFYRQSDIEKSGKSNRWKLLFLEIGLYTGIAAIAAVPVTILLF